MSGKIYTHTGLILDPNRRQSMHRTNVQTEMQRVLYRSVPQTFQKLRPQTEVTGKKRNRAGSWWKLQMQADLQTQDKLKESSCPQVAPVKGEKSYRNEMLP